MGRWEVNDDGRGMWGQVMMVGECGESNDGKGMGGGGGKVMGREGWGATIGEQWRKSDDGKGMGGKVMMGGKCGGKR